MADLASTIEVTKLARELRADEGSLAFLADRSPAELRDLRAAISAALFERHADRVTRLAGLSGILPTPLTAKIAEHALGPMLSARVAGALDPQAAAKLAGYLSPEFLTELSISLDPTRVAPIVTALPDELVIDVGRRLLAKGEHLVLGRFVAIVDPQVALAVIDGAPASDILQVALFTEAPAALDAVVRGLDDATLADIIRAAADANAYDGAVALLASLSDESCARLVEQVGAVTPEARNALVAAVAKHEVWPQILPALHAVPTAELAPLVNVETTLDPGVVDRVIQCAHDLDLAPSLVQLVLALDDAHLNALKDAPTLADPAVQDWLLTSSGVSERLVRATLVDLGVRAG